MTLTVGRRVVLQRRGGYRDQRWGEINWSLGHEEGDARVDLEASNFQG